MNSCPLPEIAWRHLQPKLFRKQSKNKATEYAALVRVPGRKKKACLLRARSKVNVMRMCILVKGEGQPFHL